VDREGQESRDAPASADRHRRLRTQIVDQFARFQNVALDLDEWSDLTTAALGRLHAPVAEQRRLATGHRLAIITVGTNSTTSSTASAATAAAACDDRRSSARDRNDSAGDRDPSARDRSHAAVQREQVNPISRPARTNSVRPPNPAGSGRCGIARDP
jgi:hypothetical protein